VPGGALDDDPGVVPDVLIYCGSKAAWCTVDESSNRFVDAGPAEFWGRVVRKLYGAG